MIKRLVSKQVGKNYQKNRLMNKSRIKRNESSIWQRRFWEHHIISQEDYTAHLNYCYMNPVKHGLVQSMKDWKYSTFHRDVKNGLYPIDWYSNDTRSVDFAFGESVPNHL
jgi:putative transposase